MNRQGATAAHRRWWFLFQPGGRDHAGVALADLPVTADSAPCGQPLVPTGTQNLVRIFSNKGILPGAPLRNRTVDLLLTMENPEHSDLACRSHFYVVSCDDVAGHG